jgi:hypothetical protein
MAVNSLHYYTGFTLVDITATGVTRGHNDDLYRNQQRNWETVLQSIGLISQPFEIMYPQQLTMVDVENFKFGAFYQGQHRVWAWTFAVEHAGVFAIDNDPVAGLEQCFDQVPVICGLEETARFILPIFYPHGAIKNLYFEPDFASN